MAAVELCRNTNCLANSDGVVSPHQPGVDLGGQSSRRVVAVAGEEIKVSGVVESVDPGVRPAAGGELDGVARSDCVPDSGLQGSLERTEGRLALVRWSDQARRHLNCHLVSSVQFL